MDKLDIFNKTQVKSTIPDIKIGDTIRIYQKVKEAGGERTQAFEGVLIARKHGKGASATITVRKISFGVGVERIYPLHSPTVDKIEIVHRGKARRAKLYYLRERIGRKRKLKKRETIPGEKTIAKAPEEVTANADETEPSKPEEEQKKEEHLPK